jgi:hypothetical protein
MSNIGHDLIIGGRTSSASDRGSPSLAPFSLRGGLKSAGVVEAPVVGWVLAPGASVRQASRSPVVLTRNVWRVPRRSGNRAPTRRVVPLAACDRGRRHSRMSANRTRAAHVCRTLLTDAGHARTPQRVAPPRHDTEAAPSTDFSPQRSERGASQAEPLPGRLPASTHPRGGWVQSAPISRMLRECRRSFRSETSRTTFVTRSPKPPLRRDCL